MTTHIMSTQRQPEIPVSRAASAPQSGDEYTGGLTPPRSPVKFLLPVCFVTFWGIALIAMPPAECWAASPDKASESFDRVVITLRDSARITSSVVRVVDVAELRGGSEALRKQIASLDLEDAPKDGKQTEISARRIEFRLRVAGIDPRSISIRGSTVQITTSAKTGVSRSKTRDEGSDVEAKLLLASYSKLRSRDDQSADNDASGKSNIEQVVIEAAQKCLSKQLPWPQENVVIQLAQPLPRELSERALSETATCSAELRTSATPLGRITVRVVLKDIDRRTIDVPVQLDVRHYENVVVTKIPIDRGHLFSLADFATSWQDVTNLSGYCTSPDQFVGQKAKRVFPELQVLRAVDVETPVRSTALTSVVVKRRDRVTAFARSGSLCVTSIWEAQQEGRAGEVIKFKNVQSNKEVYGRVLSATEVEATD